MAMNYKISTYVAKENESNNVKGFANVVFGESLKVTNIVILQKKDSDELFISMPRYRSNEIDENGNPVYKDICNPTTSEFRESFYSNIIKSFNYACEHGGKTEMVVGDAKEGMPPVTVSVSLSDKEGSSLRGFGRIYIDDSFVIGNVSVVQGKDNLFVAMPSYKTRQIDENGKPIYQDIVFPITKDFRKELFDKVLDGYEDAKKKAAEKYADKVSKEMDYPEERVERDNPFR